MKKKFFVLILVAVVLALCLCACNEDTYLRFNKLLQEDYSQVKLTVTSTVNGETLTSTVNAVSEGDKKTVTYTIQQFAVISSDNVPDDYVVEKEGRIVVQNGKIVEKQGDQVDISFANVVENRIEFKADYFSVPQWQGSVFSATVVKPAEFLGVSIFDGTNVKVSAKATDVLEYLEISYASSTGAQVVMRYEFTK